MINIGSNNNGDGRFDRNKYKGLGCPQSIFVSGQGIQFPLISTKEGQGRGISPGSERIVRHPTGSIPASSLYFLKVRFKARWSNEIY